MVKHTHTHPPFQILGAIGHLHYNEFSVQTNFVLMGSYCIEQISVELHWRFPDKRSVHIIIGIQSNDFLVTSCGLPFDEICTDSYSVATSNFFAKCCGRGVAYSSSLVIAVVIPPQNKCFQRCTGISLSVYPCVHRSV